MRGWWLVAGVAVLASSAAVLDGDSGIGTWWTLRDDLREARGRIAELRAEIAALEDEASVLEDDPFALERAIRERLEYAKPGERVVRLHPRGLANPRIP